MELFFGRAVCSSVVARLPRPPVSFLSLGRVFRVVSSLWHVVIVVPAVSVVWETGGDHVGSSVVVETTSGSLSSSVDSSVSVVVVIVMLRACCGGFGFVADGVLAICLTVG